MIPKLHHWVAVGYSDSPPLVALTLTVRDGGRKMKCGNFLFPPRSIQDLRNNLDGVDTQIENHDQILADLGPVQCIDGVPQLVAPSLPPELVNYRMKE